MADKKLIKEMLENGLNQLKETRIVVGALIKCSKTGRVLLLLRNDPKPVWAMMSGTVEKGEDLLTALKREMYEEMFFKGEGMSFKSIGVEHFPAKNLEFHYFEGFCETEFKPILDQENLEFGWFSKDKLPSPLFKGVAEKIANI
jgi:8-oxo-dGTP pyrophosphatase MutT (NUDIX family)